MSEKESYVIARFKGVGRWVYYQSLEVVDFIPEGKSSPAIERHAKTEGHAFEIIGTWLKSNCHKISAEKIRREVQHGNLHKPPQGNS